MSFLSMAFLAALPLAAAPLLLHLFDRRRSMVIAWGAMQFLTEAARQRTHARRLRQWLLLLLRTLALACLVLALARPLVQARWLDLDHRRETILVLDNSLSMQRQDADESRFDAAVRTATETLAQIPAGDSVRVLLAAPYPVWLTPAAVKMTADLRTTIPTQLRALEPTLGGSDLLAALFTAFQTEPTSGVQRRRIVIVTDGQAADWRTTDEAGWRQLRDIRSTPPLPTDLDVVTVPSASRTPNNLAVNRVAAHRTVVGRDQPFKVTAHIQNYGSVPSSPASLRWLVDGEEQHRSPVPELDAGATHEAVWKHSASTLGVVAVICELDADDGLAADNRDTVIIETVDRLPILIVESAPDATELLRDAFFVQAALGEDDQRTQAIGRLYQPTLVTPEELERTDLQPYQAVVIPNLTALSEATLELLKAFVFDGGGLWIAAGPRTDVERFNQFLFADANGLAPLALDRIVDEPDTLGQRTLFDRPAASHSATAVLADEAQLDLSQIVVSRRFRFVPPPSGEDAAVLLRLTNGEPAAVEQTFGRGRVIVQTVPLKLQWSELARSQTFVVLVREWLDYLTEPRATRHNLAPGEPLSLQLAGHDVREATLHTPQGDDVELTADLTDDGVVFRSSRTALPGDYTLEVGLSGDLIPFTVQRDPRESDLTPLSDDERAGLTTVPGQPAPATEAALPNSMPSDPVWPLLLMLLPALLLAELLLSGSLARERFGGPAIAETSERLAAEIDLPLFVSRGRPPATKKPRTLSQPRA